MTVPDAITRAPRGGMPGRSAEAGRPGVGDIAARRTAWELRRRYTRPGLVIWWSTATGEYVALVPLGQAGLLLVAPHADQLAAWLDLLPCA